MNIKLRLSEVPDWTPQMKCTETAICAVTKVPADRVITELKNTLELHHVAEDPNGAYDPKHWSAALLSLGFHLTCHRDEYPRLSIQRFLESNSIPFARLVGAVRGKVGHLFAADERKFVDCFTEGRFGTAQDVSPELDGFIVTYACDVEIV